MSPAAPKQGLVARSNERAQRDPNFAWHSKWSYLLPCTAIDSLCACACASACFVLSPLWLQFLWRLLVSSQLRSSRLQLGRRLGQRTLR
eukprot:2042491-Amphidinium_carterae.1